MSDALLVARSRRPLFEVMRDIFGPDWTPPENPAHLIQPQAPNAWRRPLFPPHGMAPWEHRQQAEDAAKARRAAA